MSATNYRVRRATLDDLSQLTGLWRTMHFPTEELVRRVTEFQVAESPEGLVVGAVAMQVAEKNGRIHSEAFSDFGLADQLRPMLWERLNTLATNLGLLRLWTREQAPFYSQCGLVAADPETLKALPKVWTDLPASWRTLKLREDVETMLSADQEFALFMDAARRRTERTLQQARLLRGLALLAAIILMLLVLGATFVLFTRNRHLLPR